MILIPASGHENLIGRRNRVAGRGPARDDVNAAPDRRCAEAVSRCRHTRVAAPGVGFGIVGFHLVEGAGGRLTSKYEHAPLDHPRPDAAPRPEHRPPLPPAIGFRVLPPPPPPLTPTAPP